MYSQKTTWVEKKYRSNLDSSINIIILFQFVISITL